VNAAILAKSGLLLAASGTRVTWSGGPAFVRKLGNQLGITVERTDWDELNQAVRDLVQARTGPVRAARTVSAGLNSQLAAVLDTAEGSPFIKGLRSDHPGVVRQQREAMINPYVLSMAPPLHVAEVVAVWMNVPNDLEDHSVTVQQVVTVPDGL